MLSPDQARIRSFKVVPSLPDALNPLLEIARNLWWSWNPDAVDLFSRIDNDLWQASGHNPVALLGSCPQSRLEELAENETFLAAMIRAHELLRTELTQMTWFEKAHGDLSDCTVAYFSAEFGLNEALPIYSGGLGVLAGDHLKSASELGVPLVGVGLLYRNGYFQQYLNADGWQQEFYPELDFTNMSVQPVPDENDRHLTVTVDLPGRQLNIAVWEATVGRVRLLLLDTNLPTNDSEDRHITGQLYGGDMEMRIKQEIVLGIGGTRALHAAGIHPTVYHLNEGHAAFCALEHIKNLIAEHDLAFDEARQAAASAHCFTTHTPVPAGIDRFPPDMIKRYFKEYHGSLKLDMEGLLALGRENVFNKNEFFSMAVLAIRTSDGANGVSKLHGEVSREMWQGIWPSVPTEEVPIGHVTNGTHARSWLSSDLRWLFDRYFPMHWEHEAANHRVWEHINQIPDEELWRVHERRRQKLVHWLRLTQRNQLERRNASTSEIKESEKLFDHRVLTIGFARRFATYKRANLLFRDPERLIKILCDADRPVQIVIAGKAHPADSQGKDLIRQIVHFARNNGAVNRVVFVENYNIAVARYMVQGVDVWLNNPRRPMEASGTSGMKAAMNGVLNLSVLDGWWDEAYTKDIGWAIGSGENYANHDYQDTVESQAIYDLLEKQVVPMFYDRDSTGIPRTWIAWMKKTMSTLLPVFNTNRMVAEYCEKFYVPAHRRASALMADNLAPAKRLAHDVRELRTHWDSVAVDSVKAETRKPLGVRQPLDITADVQLAGLRPDDVRVQIYYGSLDADGRIVDGQLVDMTHTSDNGSGAHRYAGQVVVQNSGKHGFGVRIIPGHAALASPFIPGLIAWDVESAPEPVSTPAEPVTA